MARWNRLEPLTTARRNSLEPLTTRWNRHNPYYIYHCFGLQTSITIIITILTITTITITITINTTINNTIIIVLTIPPAQNLLSKMLTSLPLLLLAPLSVLTRPTPSSSTASSSSASLIYEFSEQRLENMAARSNGHLALTVVNSPQLYDLDPTASSPTPNLLHQFSDATSLAGIAETAPDVFAVVVGNQSSAGLGVAGSFSVWSVNLNTPEATVGLITTIPGAEALNGMTTVSGGSSDIVLIADSSLGAVWRVNVATGDYSIAIQDSHFTNSSTARGINGVHVLDGELYFTNSAQESYGHVAITDDGSANGDVEVYGIPAGPYDDFAFDSEGNSWIATHPGSLTEWSKGGAASNMTGGGMEQPTSVKFGRGSTQEESTLYMVTYGNPEPGNGGGQIFAIST